MQIVFVLFCLLYAVYAGSARLSDQYLLEWKIDTQTSIITFNITVNRLDYVAIGFHDVGSVDSGMVNADIIVAVFGPEGKLTVEDYYSLTYETPSTDVALGGTDDVLTFSGSQKGGITNVIFTRKLVTQDIFDSPFTVGPVKVIWAIGPSEDFGYHYPDPENRGSKVIDLFSDDVCGPTQGCNACLSHPECVYCGSDGLCYDKTNVGSCETINTTCTEECPEFLDNAAVPLDFCASVFVSGLSNPRGIVAASNGDILVVEAGRGVVTVFWEENGDVKRNPLAAASGLNHGIAIHNDYLYASSQTTVYRWKYIAGMRNPLGTGEVVIHSIPSRGHATRTLQFDWKGFLYVSIGSGANVDPNSNRARVLQFDVTTIPSGGINWNVGVLFADGMRNEVGLALDLQGRLWGVENGVDDLNRADLGGDIHSNNPSEEVNLMEEAGKFYGYPYCWSEYDLPVYGLGKGTQWVHPNFMNDGVHSDDWCRNTNNVLKPKWNMLAHQAPLDILFYNGTSFPTKYYGGAFVALHGSWNRQPAVGYKVIFISFNEGVPVAEEDFLKYSGSGSVWPNNIRPVSLAFAPCGEKKKDCLFVTSSNGQIIQISFSG
jgi:glucose/arabinose dehydrogenase